MTQAYFNPDRENEPYALSDCERSRAELDALHAEIARLQIDRQSLREALAALHRTAVLYSVDGAEESMRRVRAALKGTP